MDDYPKWLQDAAEEMAPAYFWGGAGLPRTGLARNMVHAKSIVAEIIFRHWTGAGAPAPPCDAAGAASEPSP